MGAPVGLEGREGLSQAPAAKPCDPFLPLITEDSREGVRSSGLPGSHGEELVWDVGPGRLELVKARHSVLFLVSCDLKRQASGAKVTVDSVWLFLSTDGCGSN